MLDLDERFRFGLLGELEAVCLQKAVDIPGRRARALFAMLLLHANQVVSTERLITGLWAAEQPKAARQSVHYFVHQIRRALPESGLGRGVLERHGGGYLLRVPPTSIDVVCFEKLLDLARAVRDGGDQQAAWAWYTEALALWRGPALDGFAAEPFAGPEITRLEELKLVAVTERLAVGLDLGRHEDLVGELDAHLQAHPDREDLRYLQMLALYRSGGQREALDAYRVARNRLGLAEPGDRLQRLRHAILAEDPELDLTDRGRPRGLPNVDGRTGPAHDAMPPVPEAATRPEAPPPPTRPSGGEPPESVPSERKLVTVLAVGVMTVGAGACRDPEDASTRTAEVMERAARRIRRYGGVVATSAVGRLLATFGADRSHEDDPERAVRAALDVVGGITGSGGDDREDDRVIVHAGVATGAALVTHDAERRAGVTGDVVHRAVLLEKAAEPGTVLASAATRQATSRSISYCSAEPPARVEPARGMALWRALGPRSRTGTTGGVAGELFQRQRELALLGELLDRFLHNRSPQSLVIVGEPGLGKSRLVAELGRMVDAAPDLVTWHAGRVRPDGQDALGAVREILRWEAGILDGDDAQRVQAKVRAAVAAVLPDDDGAVAESLGLWLGADGPEPPVQRLLDDGARFLAAVATRRPLVIVLEDLQWADAALLEFVSGLVGRAGKVPLLLVITARPEFLDRWQGWTGGHHDAVTFSLPPLNPATTRRLLERLLPGRELPEPALAAMVERSGGNPLYVQEYARMLTEQADADFGAEPPPTPTSVRQVVTARIDTLPLQDKRLLQDAAVVGETGLLGQLTAVSGRSRDEVRASLRRLERYEFLRLVRVPRVAGETAYAFRHALVREVAYEQLLRADRVDRHQRAADWIESSGPGTDAQVEQLAHHYGRALELSLLAGRPTQDLAERAQRACAVADDPNEVVRSSATALLGLPAGNGSGPRPGR